VEIDGVKDKAESEAGSDGDKAIPSITIGQEEGEEESDSDERKEGDDGEESDTKTSEASKVG